MLFVVLLVRGDVSAAAGETNFLSQVRQLTFEGRRAGEGYFSADGRKLVFQSEREPQNPFYQIYTLDLETGESVRVSPGTGKTTCAFLRPGSGEVLFASTHLDPQALTKQKDELEFRASGKQRRYAWDYDEHMDLFVAGGDGSSIRRLTDAPGYDAEGSYSPDGRLVVFCSLRDAYPTNALSVELVQRFSVDPSYFGELYLMNADGSNQRRLTRTPGYDGGPFFSADGRRIIWRRFDDKGLAADVYTMATDGTDERRLTEFGAMSWAPYFHPSGDYVIFTANKLGFGNFELFLVDSAGTKEPVRVTATDGFDGLPVFSPDGTQLCWTSSRSPDGKSQLFMARWNHEAAKAQIASATPRGGIPPTAPGELPMSVSAEGAPARVMAEGVGNFSSEIREGDLRQQVSFLASSDLAGRMTGSEGSRLASEYIHHHLRRAGLRPLGTNWFQEFEFTAGTRLVTNENHLAVRDHSFQIERSFRPLAFSANGSVTGNVVFAGYGLRVPGKPGEGYDSYAGLDVSNKIVMVLRYVPEDVTPERRQELNRYAGLRYKAMLARDLGAKAVLVVTGPKSPGSGELVALSSDSSLSGSGIVAASVDGEVAAALFQGTGRDLAAVQSGLDNENPHALSGFEITNGVVNLTTRLEHVRKSDRNVLGWLPGTSSEVVVLGAHFDHLGLGEASGSINRKGEEGQICYGADDNASGVALLLELAAHVVQADAGVPERPRRGVVFAFWSGEEVGLLGSTHFAEHPLVALSNVVAYLNFDMVGRLRDNRLLLQGVGSSLAWRRLIERRNVAAGFQAVLQDDPFLPTDSTAFYPRRVPVLAFFTGSHEDYHRPTDRHETLNYEGMVRIAEFAGRLLDDVRRSDTRPDYVEVVRSSANPGSRDSLRAYLGTIPDYAGDVEGVKLSGVRAGSPADEAGIKGGDIIVSMAGRKISNVYDYTYSLDSVKIGQPVELVVIRDGQRVPLQVTPAARK
jgi:Tol biopolymer transport system component